MNGVGGKAAGKVFVLLVVGVFVQTTFGADLRIDNVAPDFMMLLAVCAGIAGGAEAGALVGFAAGMASDLFLQSTPLGLSALAVCLTGFAVGWARTNLFRPNIVVTPLLAGAATMFGVVAFVVIGYLVGQGQLVAPGKRWLVEVAFVEGVYSALLSLPVAALMAWALRGLRGAFPAAGEGGAEVGLDLPPRRVGAALSRSRSATRARPTVRAKVR